jgi:hypothetical protein
MARYPLVISDDLMARIDDHCTTVSAVKSKLLRKWVTQGFQREIEAHLPAETPVPPHFLTAVPEAIALAPVPPPPPAAPAAAPAPQEPQQQAVETMANGAGTWFEIKGVCAALGITTEALLEEIDDVDDVLQYANRNWIDERGIAEARTLCPVPATSDSFWAWAQSKIK